MNEYTVTISATVTKDIVVNAINAEQAEILAHEIFTVASDNTPEHYSQETADINWLETTSI